MSSILGVIFEHTVSVLLRAYPAAYRARFGGEMRQVYRALACDTARERGVPGLLWLWLRVLLDGMRGALAQWAHHWFQQITKRRMAIMDPNPLEFDDGTVPLPRWQAALAVLPFLLNGLAAMSQKPDIIRLPFAEQPTWLMLLIHPFFLFNWLVLIGLGAGILLGLPRWAYSYLGWALLMAFSMANMSFNELNFGGVMCLPPVVVIVLALLIRRASQPLQDLFDRLERDITIVALGVYTFYTYFSVDFDLNHNPYLLFFMLATTMANCLGAWGYFRSARPLQRVGFLIGGMVLAIGFNAWASLSWDYAAFYDLPEGAAWVDLPALALWIALPAALMLGLGWIAERHRRVGA